MTSHRPEVVVVMNGFQPHYEADFTNALARRGVHVHLIASDLTLWDRLEPGVHAVNLRGSQDPKRSRLRKIANILRYQRDLFTFLMRRRPVAVHLAGWFSTRSSMTGILEALLLRLVGRPFVFTVHNILPHGRRNARERFVHRLLYRIPHHLVVHTRRMKEELIRDYGIHAGKICHMEHGIDEIVPRDDEKRREVRSSLGLGADDRLLLMFGNVNEYKGADTLVESLDLLDERFHVVIAGRGDPGFEPRLAARIEASRARDRIRRVDRYLDDDEIFGWFQAADALVLPYRAIDQSGVLFQALRHGTPVLAFDVGSFSDYISPSVGMITADRTGDGLARLVQQFFAAPDPASPQGVRRAAERYLWANTVHDVIPLYPVRR